MKLLNVKLIGKLADESFQKKDGTTVTNSCAMFQENNSNYSKPFKCNFYGKSIDVIKGMVVNNDYDLAVNIESIESGGKYYTKVSCYGANNLSQSNQIVTVSQPMAQPNRGNVVSTEDMDNDLPF